MMTSSPSLVGRAVLAVVLMAGFYLLAAAIAGGLLYIPYAELVYAHRLHPKLALGCLLGAVAILWSVLPRFDKFEAPGPQLTRQQHPQLFGAIESVATTVGQAMPAEVFLVADVNAWVAQRGGIMGFGSRRVMGLGLPLMRVISCSELRAVLAHEFGHYHGGDTRLGPWVYKTRGAIGRTLGALSGGDGKGSLLQLPFLWYGKMFLRITHAVSRRQEFVADELAAQAVGSKPLISGLRKIHSVAPAFQFYWSSECAPVLNSGFRPPIVDGFAQFVHSGPVAELIQKQLDEELQAGKSDPYDTHPPLKERIAAVEQLPAGKPGGADPEATTLLTNIPALETQLLATLASPEASAKLTPITWEETCGQVYLPQWKKLYNANRAALEGVSAESLPGLAGDLQALGQRCVDPSGEKVVSEEAERIAKAVVGAALLLLLASKGARLDTTPGKAVSVSIGSATLEPFSVLEALKSRSLNAESWRQRCQDLSILGEDLGKVAVS